MLQRQGNAICGKTPKSVAISNTVLFTIAGLPFFLPPLFSLILDGFHGPFSWIFLFMSIEVLPGLLLLYSAYRFGLRKIIQPDELSITTTGIALARQGRLQTCCWADIGEPDITKFGRSELVVIPIIPGGRRWRLDPSDYGVDGETMIRIIAAAHSGVLMKLVYPTNSKLKSGWISWWVFVLGLAGAAAIGVLAFVILASLNLPQRARISPHHGADHVQA